MGKTCLNKNSLAVAYDCDLPVHGVKDIHIIDAEDIKSFTISPDGLSITALELVEGGVNNKVEGFKQNITYTEELVEGDYANFIKPTVTFRKPANVDFTGNSFGQALANRKFVVFVVFNEVGKYSCLGIQNPLVLKGLERDVNANGNSTMYTLSTEDGNFSAAIHDSAPLAGQI